MKVSIMMCAYNSGAYIEEAILSILAQTYTNWELVIGNDCSTDNTLQIISKYTSDKRIRLINHPSNLGYTRNKNTIFGHATGDLLTQLDADDLCPPNRLERQVGIFMQRPDVMICGANFTTIDIKGNEINTTVQEYDMLIRELMSPYPFWYPSLMYRKKVIEEFGLFSEYFRDIYGDDNYHTYRINSKYPIYFIKEPLYFYRIHPASMTHTHDNPRKLIADDILRALFAQRKMTGTDWLENGESDKMRAFEQQLLKNKKLMAEKYRMVAAQAIDNNKWEEAKKFLKKSIRMSIRNAKTLATLSYYLRSKYLNKPADIQEEHTDK